MINNFLFFYRNYNYLYYGISIYYTINISYSTYYYCNLAYNYLPYVYYYDNQKENNPEIVMTEIKNNDLCEKWTLIEKKN